VFAIKKRSSPVVGPPRVKYSSSSPESILAEFKACRKANKIDIDMTKGGSPAAKN